MLLSLIVIHPARTYMDRIVFFTKYMLLSILLGVSFSINALSLRSDYPKRYVVKEGDTLWGIASKYLYKPWEWKTLWQANPKIHNPNRIYPGTILELSYDNQLPYIRVLSNGTIKLSPNMRPMHNSQAIPAISLTDIKPFLNSSLVMDQDRLENAPYIVGFNGDRLLGGQGDEVYVKNLHHRLTFPKGASIAYGIYRQGCPYYDGQTHRFLGYNATLIGYGELVRGGNPSTVQITNITEGVRIDDRIMLNDFPPFNLCFVPKVPSSRIKGKIIALPGDYTRAAIGFVAVIDRGQDAGLEPGDVLAIYSRQKLTCNPHCDENMIILPPERIGELMIFRTFSHTSFALIMRSTRAIYIKDTIVNP